jgi:hypothetical protein
MTTTKLAILAALVLALAPVRAHAATFPADSAFVPLRCHDGTMTDARGDDAPFLDARDVVGEVGAAAGLRASDDQFLYLRMRLDADPAPGGTPGVSAWGMAFDLDGDRRTYEVLVLVSGIAGGAGSVSVFTNKTTTTPNDRTDPADQPAAATYTFANAARTVTAASTTGGNPDYYLDVAIPWTALQPLGLDRDTPTYVWVASSSQADRLDGDFACFDERTGTATLDGTSSDPTTGDPNRDSGSPGGERLEGGGGCGAAGGAPGAALIVVMLVGLVRARAARRGAR